MQSEHIRLAQVLLPVDRADTTMVSDSATNYSRSADRADIFLPVLELKLCETSCIDIDPILAALACFD